MLREAVTAIEGTLSSQLDPPASDTCLSLIDSSWTKDMLQELLDSAEQFFEE